jgi:hypothetical protein
VECEVKGALFLAYARDRQGAWLEVHPITPNISWRRVTGRSVVRHWRLTKNRRQSVHTD